MKAFLLIAIIACATAGNTFLGNYRENMQKAQAEFDAQFAKMQKLEIQAQDLSAAVAAAAGGVDPEAVVGTINGLTEAAKFWGGFIGNEVFDRNHLTAKINELR